MTKKMLLTVAAVSVLSGGLVVVTNAFAQAPAPKAVPSLVQEIADTFHLNTNDVQSVFDQHKKEMQTQRESNYETYLQNLVNTGKITEEQKQLLLNKHQQLINQMQSDKNTFKNMTPAERKAQMQSTMQDLKTWAQQNNISLQYLHPFGIGMRGFGRFGQEPPVTPTP